uniref:Uncharacterized protein n=1 Tax=Amphimedon queenslandica TaxID=400682 RepID=A0A1X7STH3_AMPQE
MATASLGLVEVEIENEKYSLLSVPEAYCSLAQSERKKLAGIIDFEKFANSIEHVGNFIKVAYNGANAVGPQFADLQIEIQRLGFDITRLCNESSVTIDRFRSTAATVSSDLISVYHFLLDGFEDFAIQSLASLGKLAEEMAKTAHELKEKFKMQADEVLIITETKNIKEFQQALRNEEVKELKKQVEQDRKEHEKLVNRYYELAKEAKEERMKYKLKEEKELVQRDEGSGFLEFISLAISVLPWADNRSNSDKEYSLETAKRFEEIAKEKAEIELQMEQYHLKGLQKMSEFAGKLQHMTTEKEMGQVAIEALHEASGGLRKLAVIMEEAARFWSYVQNQCQTMAKRDIKEIIEMYVTKDEKERKRLWNNPEFIKKGVSYHAGWVALRDVCKEYGMRIESTRLGLYSYVQENPSYEESLARLPKLTKDFTDAIDKGKKALLPK